MPRKRALDPSPVYYVYVLFDWCGIPFYVGKGKGNRMHAHGRSTDPVNQLKNEIIEQTWIMLEDVPKVVVRGDICEKDAFETEIALIKVIGRRNLDTGSLINLTDGGEGKSGYRHHRLTLEKMSKSQKIASARSSPEARRQTALKRESKISVEARKNRALKAVATRITRFTSAEMSEFGRNAVLSWISKSTHQERSARSVEGNKKQTPKERSLRQKKANNRLTPAERSARSYKAQMGRNPIERLEHARKAGKRAYHNFNDEERTKIATDRYHAMPEDVKISRARKISLSMTSKQKREASYKAWTTRRFREDLTYLLILLLELTRPQNLAILQLLD